MEQDQALDNPAEHFVPSGDTQTGRQVPLVELGLVPFTPYHKHVVTSLDTIFLDQNKKRIVRMSEKRLKIGYRPIEVMVTEKTVMQGTNEDPQLLAMENIEVEQYNAYNVSKLVEDDEHYKERMLKMKETLVKERIEGKDLKIKHDDTFSEFESLKKGYQVLESDKDALILSVAITKGENRDLERNISELEM